MRPGQHACGRIGVVTSDAWAVSAVSSQAIVLQEDVAHHVASFMLQDLRRFQMFDSSATRPYTVSAMACWKRASDVGYITLNKDKKVSSTGSFSLAWRGCCGSQSCLHCKSCMTAAQHLELSYIHSSAHLGCQKRKA